MAWWQLPFTIEHQRDNGTMRRTVVKRGWNGRLYRWGSQAEHYADGKKEKENFAYGQRFKAHCVNWLKRDETARYWDEQGREITGEQYLAARRK